MFATEDDYAQAVKDSSIHMHGEKVENESKVKGLISLSILAIVGYYGFNYYSLSSSTIKNKILAQNLLTQPTAVMGVTYTNNISDDEYLSTLNNMEIDTDVRKNLIDKMSLIINDTSSVDNSTYTAQLNKEITNEESTRVIVVKRGDTLASLSEKYYGDAMQYKKIIASNASLSSDSSIIYAGQKIKLPY